MSVFRADSHRAPASVRPDVSFGPTAGYSSRTPTAWVTNSCPPLSAADEELEKIATGKSLKVPTALDAEHKAKQLEMLSKKSGLSLTRPTCEPRSPATKGCNSS